MAYSLHGLIQEPLAISPLFIPCIQWTEISCLFVFIRGSFFRESLSKIIGNFP